MKTAAGIIVLTGIVLLLPGIELLGPFRRYAYFVICIGLVILGISQIKTRDEASLLCRIGFHRFERLEPIGETPGFYRYRCRRCGKEKKAFSTAA